MYKIFSLFFIAGILISCNNNTKTDSASVRDSSTVSQQLPEEKLITTGCYGYNQNGDHINFTITNAGDSIVGNLEYALAGKDKNSGMFSGMLYGNRLMGMYRFNSEGMESTRQMAFIVNNNTLQEGFGEIKETDKGILFQDTSTLKYTSALLLKRDSCR